MSPVLRHNNSFCSITVCGRVNKAEFRKINVCFSFSGESSSSVRAGESVYCVILLMSIHNLFFISGMVSSPDLNLQKAEF